MLRKCNRCLLSTDISDYLKELMVEEPDDTIDVTIMVEQWDGGSLIKREMSLDDFCIQLQNQLQTYTRHLYIIKSQNYALKENKKHLTPGSIILQTDFTENYAIKHQGEVMAAHWKPSTGASATIYTYCNCIL
jgi:hypothetical protein